MSRHTVLCLSQYLHTVPIPTPSRALRTKPLLTINMGLDGKGQKLYWETVASARQKRLERLRNTPVGVLYIRPGETEKQARKRIIEAEAKRLGLNYQKFKESLDIRRKRPDL